MQTRLPAARTDGEGGLAYLGHLVQRIRAERGAKSVLLVDAGDVFFAAPPISEMVEGNSTLEAFNMIGMRHCAEHLPLRASACFPSRLHCAATHHTRLSLPPHCLRLSSTTLQKAKTATTRAAVAKAVKRRPLSLLPPPFPPPFVSAHHCPNSATNFVTPTPQRHCRALHHNVIATSPLGVAL